MAFTKGQFLTADQLNAAFDAKLDLGSVSAFSRTQLLGSTAAVWLLGLGLGSGAPGAANGVAMLDGTGRLPSSALPASITGAMVYVGTWNPATNSPTLTSGVGTKGNIYRSSGTGTTNLDGNNTWRAGDMAVFNGTTWDKWDATSTEVYTVAGRTGDVTIASTDVTDSTSFGRALLTAATLRAQQTTLGIVPGAVVVAGTTTLTAAQSGSSIRLQGSSPYTVTLPDPATSPSIFYVTNLNSNAITFQSPTAAWIWANGGGSTTYVLPVGASAVFYSNSDWYTIVSMPFGSGGAGKLVQLDGSGRLPAVDGSQLLNLPSAMAVPVRQTVLNGPQSSGLPSFLPATSGSLSITSQNIGSGVNALVATAAGGFGLTGAVDLVGRATSNLTWSGLTASATNYLAVSISGGVLTPVVVTLAPIYQYGGTPSTVNGQFTFDITAMVGYVGNGTTADLATNIVFVGEVDTNTTSVTATRPYAYRRAYRYVDTGSLPAAGSKTTKAHNIGTTVGITAAFAIQCAIAEDNYAVGDIVYGVATEAGGGPWWGPLQPVMLKNTMYFTPGALNGYVLFNANTGAGVTLTLANWRYILTANSTW